MRQVEPAEGVYSKKKNLAGGTRWSATGGGTGGKGPARKVVCLSVTVSLIFR